MSIAEIENQLPNLTADQLRELALKSWQVFVAKEDDLADHHECSEEDPKLLAALDEAIANADGVTASYSADEVRDRLKEWTSR